MALEWLAPIVSAASGLAGVAIGGWLTRWRDRDQRRHDFRRRQLDEFYALLCALRDEIRAKGAVRVRVSMANNAEWGAAFEGVKSPDRMTAIGDEMRPTFKRAIDYDND
jgi:hypothetical protein